MGFALPYIDEILMFIGLGNKMIFVEKHPMTTAVLAAVVIGIGIVWLFA